MSAAAKHPGVFSSKIVKGGALIPDALRFARSWDPCLSVAQNRERLVASNALAKRSRVRTEEVIGGVLIPRFVAPGPHVLAALRRLSGDPNGFQAACYYEAARSDGLLAAFAEGPVYSRWRRAQLGLSVPDVVEWLGEVDRELRWSPALRQRMARGLLATLRDFGVLRGASHKEIARPELAASGFGYVAWRESEAGASSRGLLVSPIWHRWLLDEEVVRAHFGELARLGVVSFAQTGSAVRLDWLVNELEELADVVA